MGCPFQTSRGIAMTKERKNLVAKEILSWIFNRDQELAVKISSEADKIARDKAVTVEEVKEFLDPWVQYVLRHDDSH